MRGRGFSDAPAALTGARRILLVRLDNIGDVVLLSPAIAAIRQACPDAELTLLASPAGALAAPLLPAIDHVIEHRASWQQLDPGAVEASTERALIEQLRAEAFDAAIIFTSFSQTPVAAAYACYLAGIPLRAAFNGDAFSGELITHAVSSAEAPEHQAERAAFLVGELGLPLSDTRLRLAVPRAARAEADDALSTVGIGPLASYVAIVPGASASARRYSAERFAEVARDHARRGEHVVVVGSARETSLVDEITERAGDGVSGLAGRTSVPALAALIQRARLVVANNSLALHLADAFGTPVVSTYAGTDPASYWGPRRAPHRLITAPADCAPCFRITCNRGHECLDIPAHSVVAAGMELLEPVVAGSGEGTSE